MSIQSNHWESTIPKENNDSDERLNKIHKFGTFVGVFIPCILMLFGVIIFLRLGWIVGQVGLSTVIVIISISALIALVTSLSMASISTNIEIGQGGIYYMLSRSLGIEVGSAIGMLLFLKDALVIAFSVIGFAESIHELLPGMHIKIIGIYTLIVLTILAFTSIRGTLKVQIGIFVTIIASLISFFLGGEVTPMNPVTITPPPFESLKFWAVFALFFPAMTGMESSVSLSGNLRNPSRSLPIGTISAILVAYLMYICIAVFLVKHVPLDRLAQDPLIMQDIARIPSLILVGIWGATLSSALGGLLGAPRTLQAIANDGIVPKFFGKTFGRLNEPRIATVTTCVIALIGIYFGSVNMIAPLLAMISLICYAVLNFSAGIESLIGNPSWRPRFRIHWSLSIFGAGLCLITMLMIDAGSALISLSLVSLIYFFVNKRKFQVSWMDTRQGILLFLSKLAIYRLSHGANSSTSWRPHLLVFTKSSDKYSTGLLKFSKAISQNKGFLTFASFVPIGSQDFKNREALSKLIAQRFKSKNIHAFIQIKETDKIPSGMRQMIEYYGLGPVVPNTIVFGGINKEDESVDFASVVHFAHERQCNIIMLSDDHLEEIKQSNQEIHIWWDEQNQHNSELMLVLAYMLQRNETWNRPKICIKAIVSNELMKEAKLLEFKKINRLVLNVELFVSSDSLKERLDLVKEFSKHAGITLIGMSPPKKHGPIEKYMEYLQTISYAVKHYPQLAFVLSSQDTDLNEILT